MFSRSKLAIPLKGLFYEQYMSISFPTVHYYHEDMIDYKCSFLQSNLTIKGGGESGNGMIANGVDKNGNDKSNGNNEGKAKKSGKMVSFDADIVKEDKKKKNVERECCLEMMMEEILSPATHI